MEQSVTAFFLRYKKANSASNVSGIGDLYADSFMFGGPHGTQVVKKEDFLKVVPKRKSYFATLGLSETQLGSVEVTVLSDKYLLAKVAWRMKLQEPFHNRHLDTLATYVLARGNEDALSIVFQIDHQDLVSVIENLQSTAP